MHRRFAFLSVPARHRRTHTHKAVFFFLCLLVMYVIRSFPASIKLDAARLHNEIKNMKSFLGSVAYNILQNL